MREVFSRAVKIKGRSGRKASPEVEWNEDKVSLIPRKKRRRRTGIKKNNSRSRLIERETRGTDEYKRTLEKNKSILPGCPVKVVRLRVRKAGKKVRNKTLGITFLFLSILSITKTLNPSASCLDL